MCIRDSRTEGIQNARMTFNRETLKPEYQLVIGEAGESCAFYIAGKMGMPEHMIKNAAIAAYGKDELPEDLRSLTSGNKLRKEHTGGVQKQKNTLSTIKTKFQPGDSAVSYTHLDVYKRQEKKLHKIVPAMLDLFVTPLVSVFVTGYLTLSIIGPIFVTIENGLLDGVQYRCV